MPLSLDHRTALAGLNPMQVTKRAIQQLGLTDTQALDALIDGECPLSLISPLNELYGAESLSRRRSDRLTLELLEAVRELRMAIETMTARLLLIPPPSATPSATPDPAHLRKKP